MAEKQEKAEKFYTPEEVAVAVLKKAEELLKKSRLFKSNTSHEIEAGEEPHNDDAEAPEYLANADIEDSGAHGEKKAKKASAGMKAADEDGDGDVDGADAMEMADEDGDGDIDGDDAIEAKEEETGKDLDNDDEAGESNEHKAKIKAAAKPAEKLEEDKDADEIIDDAAQENKKPPFAKSEGQGTALGEGVALEKKYMGFEAVKEKAAASGASDPDAVAAAVGRKKYGKKKFQEAAAEGKKMKGMHTKKSEGAKSKHDRCVEHVEENSPEVKNPHAVCVAEGVKPAKWKKSIEPAITPPGIMRSEKECEPEMDLRKPSLKKFMLRRKMKKCGQITKASGMTSDARAAEKMSGAAPAPAPQESFKQQSPAAKVKAQPKLEMEKNKGTEKLLGIKPKAGK